MLKVMCYPRRTKIIATLGPSSNTVGKLVEMIGSGMDCARLNCSHTSEAELRELTKKTREASKQAGRPVSVMFDLQGPKMRLGELADINAIDGDELSFVSGDPRTGEIPVNFEEIASLLTDNSEVVIGDGYPRLNVSEKTLSGFKAKVTHPGQISSNKGFSVTYSDRLTKPLTEKDEEDLKVALEEKADFVALSFVRSVSDVEYLRDKIKEIDPNSKTRIIAKIEQPEALIDVLIIGEAADGLLVARGDYGVQAGIAAVPLMQKKTIQSARQLGMMVITATEMLESMIHSPMPTRAEALDVANAVLDGTSAVMLSAETAIGHYAGAAVASMAEIIEATEGDELVYRNDELKGELSRDFAIMKSAVSLARDGNADCIVIPTISGSTGRACSRFRPKRPVLAISSSEMTAAQMTIEWGLDTRVVKLLEEQTQEGLIQICLDAAQKKYDLKEGAKVVISMGAGANNSEGTNFVTLRTIKR